MLPRTDSQLNWFVNRFELIYCNCIGLDLSAAKQTMELIYINLIGVCCLIMRWWVYQPVGIQYVTGGVYWACIVDDDGSDHPNKFHGCNEFSLISPLFVLCSVYRISNQRQCGLNEMTIATSIALAPLFENMCIKTKFSTLFFIDVIAIATDFIHRRKKTCRSGEKSLSIVTEDVDLFAFTRNI